MFYHLAKIGALLVLPSSIGLLAIGMGLLLLGTTRWRRLGLKFAISGVVFLAVAGFSPLANWGLYPLEQRFAHTPLPKRDDPVAGIIILGGFEDPWVTAGRPGLGLNEAAERLTEGLRLALRWPKSKVVFTGGVSGLFPGVDSAAGSVGEFLSDMGVAKSRLVLEARSGDTYENAVLTRDLVDPKANETWLLVTSAFHMPRAMGVFRLAGFNVTAVPVDFRTRDARDLARFFSRASRGLMRIDVAAREWIGLIVYWASGRSSAILPGPTGPRGSQPR